MKFTVSIRLSNTEGALERLLGKLRQRAFEISSMSADRTADRGFIDARFTIEGSRDVEPVIKQLQNASKFKVLNFSTRKGERKMVSGRITQKEKSFVFLYDTTLRDGMQRKGLSLSLEDKLKIAYLLDKFGVSYIEGGWPGSNPKDMEFFKRLGKNPPKNATVVAFGSTRRVGIKPEDDMNLRALLEADTRAVALVGKSSTLHVTEVLGTSLEENLIMIADSIAFMKKHGKEVIFDAEHFFDGFKADPEYALKTVKIAANAGAGLGGLV